MYWRIDITKNDAKEWSLQDYNDMGWHDVRLYTFSFVNEEYSIFIDIDYILEWKKRNGEFDAFLVVPCIMKFADVSEISIAIEAGSTVGATIVDLRLSKNGYSPNGDLEIYSCVIELDVGEIRFSTSGFIMNASGEAVRSDTQDLGRNPLA